jgi:hypothetical protein
MAKTVFRKQRIATEKPTCRYRSGALPRSPFLDSFRFADQPLTMRRTHSEELGAVD